MAPSLTLNDLPDEVLESILQYLSAEHTLRVVQQVSKRFLRLTCEPLLWRYHCKTDFRYWDDKHRIKQKFKSDIADVDYRKLYIYRKSVDLRTTKLLDSILSEQIGRLHKIEQIGEFGYDVKDTLLRHCRIRDDAEDVLARRFYSNAVLDHIHRSKALEEWHRIGSGEDIPLERALGCFDMFILHDHRGDLTEITEMLDKLMSDLLEVYPDFNQNTERQKALTVAQFVRDKNLTGLASDARYRDLQNNYIGFALQANDHPSLPLISVAIYCSLARRLGLDARCNSFSVHVHAMVYPSDGYTLDGIAMSTGSDDPSPPMYLDPYRSAAEVPVEHLKSQLRDWAVDTVDFPRFLGHTSIRNMVLRTSRNILATINEIRQHGGLDAHPRILKLYGNPFADMGTALYSALWANILLCNTSEDHIPVDMLQFLPLILERFENEYPTDGAFIERYVCPSLARIENGHRVRLQEAVRVVRASDAMPKQIRSRDNEATRERVRYKVGQVFRHRRYNYVAIIAGWDVECSMSSQWIEQMQVDSLNRGRRQSFYHALVQDASIRYVAEENIEIIETDYPELLMGLAGRFFKRWDKGSHRFVSNMKDEYPDD